MLLAHMHRQAYFLGVFKLEDAPDAKTLIGTLVGALHGVARLTPQQVGTKLMAGAADGASVMAGERTGVLKVRPVHLNACKALRLAK